MYSLALAIEDYVPVVLSAAGLWTVTRLIRTGAHAHEGVAPSIGGTALAASALIVAGGASNKEAARHLGITERTVKAHVGAVFEKLQARDRLDLVLIVNGYRSSPATSLRLPAVAKDVRPTAE